LIISVGLLLARQLTDSNTFYPVDLLSCRQQTDSDSNANHDQNNVIRDVIVDFMIGTPV
jgi:hypothetical protein